MSAALAVKLWAALQPLQQTKRNKNHPLRLRTYSGHLYSMKFIHFNSTSITEIYCLTSVIDALRSFQDIYPNIRTAVKSVHAIAQARTQGFTDLAGLGGGN